MLPLIAIEIARGFGKIILRRDYQGNRVQLLDKRGCLSWDVAKDVLRFQCLQHAARVEDEERRLPQLSQLDHEVRTAQTWD